MRLSEAAHAALLRHSFPGNVRELRHALERAVALCDGDEILVEHLPPKLREPSARPGGRETSSEPSPWIEPTSLSSPARVPPASPALGPGEHQTMGHTVAAAERQTIERALGIAGGNRREAATLLGIGLRTLYEKLKRHGIK
jgi:two-component system, NtrC family, response regulator AtoC